MTKTMTTNNNHIGGKALLKQYGSRHFARIGALGGQTVMDIYGPSFFSKIGRMGAKVTNARRAAAAKKRKR